MPDCTSAINSVSDDFVFVLYTGELTSATNSVSDDLVLVLRTSELTSAINSFSDDLVLVLYTSDLTSAINSVSDDLVLVLYTSELTSAINSVSDDLALVIWRMVQKIITNKLRARLTFTKTVAEYIFYAVVETDPKSHLSFDCAVKPLLDMETIISAASLFFISITGLSDGPCTIGGTSRAIF